MSLSGNQIASIGAGIGAIAGAFGASDNVVQGIAGATAGISVLYGGDAQAPNLGAPALPSQPAADGGGGGDVAKPAIPTGFLLLGALLLFGLRR